MPPPADFEVKDSLCGSLVEKYRRPFPVVSEGRGCSGNLYMSVLLLCIGCACSVEQNDDSVRRDWERSLHSCFCFYFLILTCGLEKSDGLTPFVSLMTALVVHFKQELCFTSNSQFFLFSSPPVPVCF